MGLGRGVYRRVPPRRLGCLALLPLAWLAWGGGLAQAAVSAAHLKVDLISEQKSAQPGKAFWVGFEFQLEDGWHIYWQNAGDSGDGPKVKWVASDRFKAGDLEWPTPSRLPNPPLVNFGYENHVLLMAPIRVAPSAPAGGSVELKAAVRWLVCRQVCIPGKANLSLSVPLSEKPPLFDPETKPLFDESQAHLPKPLPSTWKTEIRAEREGFLLRILGANERDAESAFFFPMDPEQIENQAEQLPRSSGNGLELRLKRSDQLNSGLEKLRGVLWLGKSDQSYRIEAPVAIGSPAPSYPLLFMLGFAFLGGVILNLMPCVFPVLSIKVLSFVAASQGERKHLRLHGAAYTAGILVSFWALLGTLLALRAGGQQLGWGFQLQSPPFVAVLSLVLFVLGLNLGGVFEIGSSLVGVGGSLARREGLQGSFFTGVLATVVATPCTAPFMGSAVGFALSQGAVISYLVFTLLALGLAFPYLLLSVEPSLGRVLPRPGRWMETLKQAVCFPVFATVLWLLWVFAVQAGMESLFKLLAGLLIAGGAAWVFGRWAMSSLAWGFGCLLLALSVGVSLSGAKLLPADPTSLSRSAWDAQNQPSSRTSVGDLEWEKFAPERVDQYRAAGRPVFIDFTAAWCVSCQVNELLVFRSTEVKDELRKQNFALLKADWTTYDPVITRALADFGRSGVPLYVLYPADKTQDPVVLPEVINSGIVLKEIRSSSKTKGDKNG